MVAVLSCNLVMTIPPFANLLNYNFFQLPFRLVDTLMSNGCAKKSKSTKKSDDLKLVMISKGCMQGSSYQLGS